MLSNLALLSLLFAAPAFAQRGPAFHLEFPLPDNPDFVEVGEALMEARIFHDLVDALNEDLVLPTDVLVTVAECGEPNAFYIPDEQRIVMCYELIDQYYDAFVDEFESEEELDAAVIDATLFVFYHEVGHALVHLFDLPILGREEDVVDDLATLTFANVWENGDESALSAAMGFLKAAEETEELDESAFWDEHSLDLQRFYAIACLVFGFDPEKYEDMITEEILPPDRAEECVAEFQRKARAWEKLLDPFVRE